MTLTARPFAAAMKVAASILPRRRQTPDNHWGMAVCRTPDTLSIVSWSEEVAMRVTLPEGGEPFTAFFRFPKQAARATQPMQGEITLSCEREILQIEHGEGKITLPLLPPQWFADVPLTPYSCEAVASIDIGALNAVGRATSPKASSLALTHVLIGRLRLCLECGQIRAHSSCDCTDKKPLPTQWGIAVASDGFCLNLTTLRLPGNFPDVLVPIQAVTAAGKAMGKGKVEIGVQRVGRKTHVQITGRPSRRALAEAGAVIAIGTSSLSPSLYPDLTSVLFRDGNAQPARVRRSALVRGIEMVAPVAIENPDQTIAFYPGGDGKILLVATALGGQRAEALISAEVPNNWGTALSWSLLEKIVKSGADETLCILADPPQGLNPAPHPVLMGGARMFHALMPLYVPLDERLLTSGLHEGELRETSKST